jgi:hypothetical protein
MRLELVSLTRNVSVQSQPGLMYNSTSSTAGPQQQHHHVAVVIDGGPQLVSFVADAKFADGGDTQVFGYTFFKSVGNLNGGDGRIEGSASCTVGDGAARVRVYGTQLLVSELIHNYRATTTARKASEPLENISLTAPRAPPTTPHASEQCTAYSLQHTGCTGVPLCGTLNLTWNSTQEHKSKRFAFDTGGRTIAKLVIGSAFSYADSLIMCGRECSSEPACRGIVLAERIQLRGYDCFTVNETSVVVGTSLVCTSYTFAHTSSCPTGCTTGKGDGLMFSVRLFSFL